MGWTMRLLAHYSAHTMNEMNPYKAPEVDSSLPISGNGSLAQFDFKQLKKIFLRSTNVNAITFLLGIGALAMICFSILVGGDDPSSAAIVFGVFSVFPIAATEVFINEPCGEEF